MHMDIKNDETSATKKFKIFTTRIGIEVAIMKKLCEQGMSSK